MIVLVAADNIEDHPTKLLLASVDGKPQTLDHVEGLLVGVGAGGVEIEVGKRGQGLHMQLAPITQSIEPSRHEMAPAALVHQSTFRHLDTGISGHERVSVLDYRIPF